MTATELARHLANSANEDSTVWELFHENSKAGRYDPFPQAEFINQRMERMLQSQGYDQYPSIDLPTVRTPLKLGIAEAIIGRISARGLAPERLTLEQLGTLLHYAYGNTRGNQGTTFPRPFRTVPSGGALYPLEIFFHTTHVNGLEVGIYHYNPTQNRVRLLRYGDESRRLSEALVQRNLAVDVSLLVFVTAVFERSVFKYGDRGYRFVLLEAGHVAQNLALAATGMGLGCLNIGGFIDRQIDDLLGLDGVAHSTVYLAGIGAPVEAEQDGSALGH